MKLTEKKKGCPSLPLLFFFFQIKKDRPFSNHGVSWTRTQAPQACHRCPIAAELDQIRAVLAAGIEGGIKRYWKASRQFSWRKTQRDCSTAHLSEKISSAGVIPQESQSRSFTKRMKIKIAYLIRVKHALKMGGAALP